MDLSSNEVWRKTLNFSLSKKILVISRQLNLFPAKRKFCGKITTSWRFSRSLMSSKALLLIQPLSKENSLLRPSSKIESSILTRIQRKNHLGPLAWYLQDFYTQNFSTCDSFLKNFYQKYQGKKNGRRLCHFRRDIRLFWILLWWHMIFVLWINNKLSFFWCDW